MSSCSRDKTAIAPRRTSRRGFLGLVTAFVVSGCGFQPLYGTNQPATRIRDRIVVGTVTRAALPDRMHFRFQERLRKRLGQSVTDPLYRVDVDLGVEDTGLAITQDGSITRFNLTGVAVFRLIPVGGIEARLTGQVESFTAYSATATVYATRIAKRDAERRLAVDLADKIANRLAADAGKLVT